MEKEEGRKMTVQRNEREKREEKRGYVEKKECDLKEVMQVEVCEETKKTSEENCERRKG